jgi:hypothetical protein
MLYIFWIANWKAKDSTLNDSEHSLALIFSEFLPQWSFSFLGLFQNILNFHPLKEFITYRYAGMFCKLVSSNQQILSFLSIYF